MKEILEALKDLPMSADVESVAATIAIIAQHLDTLHPEKKGLFNALSIRLKNQLETLRHVRNDSPLACFSGYGPIARKLRDHVNAQRFFEIVDSPSDIHPNFGALEQKVEKYFNFRPTKDKDALDELAAFIKFTFPLMNGAAIEGREFKDLPSEKPFQEIDSGFYVDRRGPIPTQLLILRAKESEHGPQTVYVLPSSTRDEQLYFFHPAEAALYSADYSFTLPGAVEGLKRELTTLLDPLGLSVEPVNVSDFESTMHDMVTAIFDNEHRIKPSEHGCYKRNDQWSQITIAVGSGYSWMFTNTRGEYPSRSSAFVRCAGGHIQSSSVQSLNELSRQRMFKFVLAELQKVVSLIGATEFSEAA
jgi:hypothetical protein